MKFDVVVPTVVSSCRFSALRFTVGWGISLLFVVEAAAKDALLCWAGGGICAE